jgi:hypothetical protein
MPLSSFHKETAEKKKIIRWVVRASMNTFVLGSWGLWSALVWKKKKKEWKEEEGGGGGGDQTYPISQSFRWTRRARKIRGSARPRCAGECWTSCRAFPWTKRRRGFASGRSRTLSSGRSRLGRRIRRRRRTGNCESRNELSIPAPYIKQNNNWSIKLL